MKTRNGSKVAFNCRRKPDSRQGAGDRAFALLELLVVIAIIGILTSMLLPALSRVKDRARLTICLNHLKQFNLSVAMFEQDEGHLPTLGTKAEENGRWIWQLKPYLNNTEVFTAPELRDSKYDGSQWSDVSSYGWAQHLKAKSGYDTPLVRAYRMNENQNPVETIAMGETGSMACQDGCFMIGILEIVKGSVPESRNFACSVLENERGSGIIELAIRGVTQIKPNGVLTIANGVPIGVERGPASWCLSEGRQVLIVQCRVDDWI